MAVSIAQFVEQLAASGLMTAAEIESFQAGLPPEKSPLDAEALARELILAGKLTKYQAQCVHQRKTKGLVLGEYVVLDKIGEGGMGQVLKARHRTMERIVALKILDADPPGPPRGPHPVAARRPAGCARAGRRGLPENGGQGAGRPAAVDGRVEEAGTVLEPKQTPKGTRDFSGLVQSFEPALSAPQGISLRPSSSTRTPVRLRRRGH